MKHNFYYRVVSFSEREPKDSAFVTFLDREGQVIAAGNWLPGPMKGYCKDKGVEYWLERMETPHSPAIDVAAWRLMPFEDHVERLQEILEENSKKGWIKKSELLPLLVNAYTEYDVKDEEEALKLLKWLDEEDVLFRMYGTYGLAKRWR